MNIYIVRHGETRLNALGAMQGWIDEPINDSGRKLARITGRAMKDIHFDYCISSPLIRSIETVELILKESGNQIPIYTDERLKEINVGDIEGKPLSVMGEAGKALLANPFGFIGFPNGERIQDLCDRTQGFLRELIERDDDKNYLIGTHGCALRAMLNYLYENPEDFWHGHVPYNCVVNIIEAKRGIGKIVGEDRMYYSSKYVIDRYSSV